MAKINKHVDKLHPGEVHIIIPNIKEVVQHNMKKEIVSLGTKNWLWLLKLVFLTPFWLMRPLEDRKSWVEFKNNLISHKCKYDLDKPIREKYSDYCHFECLHTGCNIIDVDKSNCTECGKVIFAPKRDENLKPIPELCISCKYPPYK